VCVCCGVLCVLCMCVCVCVWMGKRKYVVFMHEGVCRVVVCVCSNCMGVNVMINMCNLQNLLLGHNLDTALCYEIGRGLA